MNAKRAVSTAMALLSVACWRIGEPTRGPAVVTWAAYPETVVVGRRFSFELGGPVAPDACGRLDTATVEIGDSAIVLGARRSVYETMCARSPVSFYIARPMSLERPGTYRVITEDGTSLGTLVAIDSGGFSPMRAVGEGTVTEAGGCLLFGPGWVGNQRPFALRGDVEQVREAADGERRVWIRGTLRGFTLCGPYGSRPVIEVEQARVTERLASEYY